jgi:hypothetical protein
VTSVRFARVESKGVIWEGDCEYARIALSTFWGWIQQNPGTVANRSKIPSKVTTPTEWWGYADYKREHEIFSDGGLDPADVDWGSLGLGEGSDDTSETNFWFVLRNPIP